MHDFVRGIKVQDLVEETLFDPVRFLLAVRRSEKQNRVVEDFSSWYYYEF